MSDVTKKALKTSLMELLEEESLDKITIKDIVEKCGVNRNTFYYHFQDIYDLLDYLFTSEAESLIEINKIYDYWKENIIHMTEYLLKHKKMIYHVYYSINKDRLQQYLYDILEEVLIKVIDLKTSDVELKEKDKHMIINFYKYAFIGIIFEWIKNDMKKDIEELIEEIGFIYEGTINSIIMYSLIKN